MKTHTIAMLFSMALLPPSTWAAAVADWKFEPGSFLTDSSDGNNLTRTGSVDQVSYPSSGRGTSFPAGHTAGAEFNSTGEYLGATLTPLTGNFTVEAFINHDSNTQLENLGHHWGALIAGAFSGSNINAGAWSFETRLDGLFNTVPGELLIGLNGPGGSVAIDSNIVVLTGKDYYVAASVTLGSSGQVTFYAQNLTDAGPLQSSTRSFNRPSLNSFGTVWIGETPDGFNFLFDGVIDEVRLSNAALTSSELLINAIPVPAGLPLLVSALVALSCYGRRRRNS